MKVGNGRGAKESNRVGRRMGGVRVDGEGGGRKRKDGDRGRWIASFPGCLPL